MSERRIVILGLPQSNNGDPPMARFRPRRVRADGRSNKTKCDRDISSLSVLSLAKYERADQDDNYRHRMAMNGLALICVVILMVIGIWLVDNIT
jgi:hypothetical protein